MQLWDELKERKLVQWVLAYIAFGIAILEILNAVQVPFGLSNPLVRVIMVAIVAGFGLAVVLAWFHGERGHQRVTVLEVLLLLLVVAAGTLTAAIAWRPESEDRGAMTAAPPSSAAGWQAPPAAAQHNSIAVLPFANLSGNPQDDYFSDGITDELTNALGELPGLRVAARTSAFQFKGQNKDLREVGRELGVAALLEGSVQRAGGKVRILARLVDATTGYRMWSGQVDADAGDIFAAEDKISRAVADALQVKLALATVPTENKPPADSAAHQSYLKGRALSAQETPTATRQAAQEYRAALQRDPRYARAWASLAQSYMNFGRYGFMPAPTARDSARWAASRALRIDSTLPDAHFVMGRAADNLDVRIHELRRAVELNPSSTEARLALGEALAARGQARAARGDSAAAARDAQAAIQEARSATQLDPLGRQTHEEWRRLAVFTGHDSLGAFPMPPGAPGGPAVPGVPRPGAIHAQLCADFAADPTLAPSAPQQCAEARRFGANDPNVLGKVALGLARLGRRDEALDVLRAYDALTPADTARLVTSASVRAALGDLDTAFSMLRGAPPAQLRGLLDDARLAPLRGDPRFAELQRRAASG